MPNQYLITLSIGPVQDFIAAARRTRDLWFGSYLLSEISKAAAASFKGTGAELIFPSPGTDLSPNSHANVGNKLLLFAATDNPKQLVKEAKQAASACWETLAANAKKKVDVNEAIWDQQLSDTLEFFATWVLLENPMDYGAEGKGRMRLEVLLNARKNTRDFLPNPVAGDTIAKSSLDGLRESVLPTTIKSWEKRKLGLSDGEQLDCSGIVKRLGGSIDQFTPLSRLAVDPWLRNPECQSLLSEMGEDFLAIFKNLIATDSGLVSQVQGNGGIYELFPYDGQLLYDFRIQAERDSLVKLSGQADTKTLEQIATANKWLDTLQSTLNASPFKALPKPTSYVAILVADGDRMGVLLNDMSNIEDHRNISTKLSEFASQAPKTIRNHRGHCVYAGGDDVLALLPLDKAIECARQLAIDFSRILAEVENIGDLNIPTLSVGLGISHFLTPMSQQLALARRAEQLAKSNHKPEGESKNALAILLQPRSGAEIRFRERWNNAMPPAEILGKWIKAYNEDLLPRRFGYQLRELALALEWCDGQSAYQSFIEQETSRILQRKRNRDGSWVDDDLISLICERAGQIGLKRLADELVLTRRFAEAHKLSGEPVPGETDHG